MISLSSEYQQLIHKNNKEPLSSEELARAATVAYLIGKNNESEDFWNRAYNQFLNQKEALKAVRCAFWIAFQLLSNGDFAKGGGWISRAQRILDKQTTSCVERGYLLLPTALQAIFSGDNKTAYSKFTESSQIAEQFFNPDLLAFARHGQGRSLIRMGKVSEGISLLDEAMLAVTSDEVSEIFSGDVYCSVIEGCYEVFDLKRAQEWTNALIKWCDNHPGLVPYRGQCLVRQAEIKQLQGQWQEALKVADHAGKWLSEPPGKAAAGEAFYRMAELLRLKGDYKKAEKAYLQGHKWGKIPQPGLALLRFSEGKNAAAINSIQNVLDETRKPAARAILLAAYVEIMLGSDNILKADSASIELTVIAKEINAPFLQALALNARGELLLKQEEPQSSLEILREAWTLWNTLNFPFETARARVQIARANRILGDKETAEMELRAAFDVFEELEAKPEMEKVVELLSNTITKKDTHGLTAREFQVLQILARGKSNKEIAADLFISERTVERHISNIFLKLNLSSRASATAWTYEQNLI